MAVRSGFAFDADYNSKVTTPVGSLLLNLLVVRLLHPILLQNRLLCRVNPGQIAYYGIFQSRIHTQPRDMRVWLS